ncbi:MAG: hypothetical protein KDI19_14085, partial [Pseudomonadales bacterium]|nr:hypothetical protein [Pseudomonadales bacterium]
MTERLFVSPRGDGFAWLVLDNATGIVRVRGEGTADELGQAARGVQVPAILVVPAEYVLLTRASIPSRQQRQLLQALPYAVEEQLAADVEDCHFAVGPRAEDGSVSAAVIETTLLAGWLERLDACGVSVEQALIDVLQVPRVQGSTLLVDGDRCLVRTGPTAGFGIDTALVPMAIALLPEDQKSSLAILVHP